VICIIYLFWRVSICKTQQCGALYLHRKPVLYLFRFAQLSAQSNRERDLPSVCLSSTLESLFELTVVASFLFFYTTDLPSQYLYLLHSVSDSMILSRLSLFSLALSLSGSLVSSIRRAILEKQTFRVVVVLPVFPAGDLTTATTRYIIKQVYQGIDRGDQSIVAMLQAEFPKVDVKQYITFYALRNYDFLTSAQHSGRGRKVSAQRGLPVTEQVYVHAKLMIVDDRRVLIGSANINDRWVVGWCVLSLGLSLLWNECVCMHIIMCMFLW
jgi:Phospholipase D Active site motif